MSRRMFVRYVGAFVAVAGCGDDTADSTDVSGSATVPSTTPPTTSATTPPGSATTTTAERPPPSLAVTFPEDGARFCGAPIERDPSAGPGCTIDGPEVTFEGSVSDGAEVLARGALAEVAGGRWRLELRLDEGTHEIEFVARDADGREARTSVAVTYAAMEPSDF